MLAETEVGLGHVVP